MLGLVWRESALDELDSITGYIGARNLDAAHGFRRWQRLAPNASRSFPTCTAKAASPERARR